MNRRVDWFTLSIASRPLGAEHQVIDPASQLMSPACFPSQDCPQCLLEVSAALREAILSVADVPDKEAGGHRKRQL